MTKVIIAASINNELEAKDIVAVQQLQKVGYDVVLYYYLPKIPAQFSMIPSFNYQLKEWREHANKILNDVGDKLNIPAQNRHFADEILGPNRVIEEARESSAQIILTNNKDMLHQSFLDKLYDRLASIFERRPPKTLPIENIMNYAISKLGKFKATAKIIPETQVSKKQDESQKTKRKAA
jgi:hypothetical protein